LGHSQSPIGKIQTFLNANEAAFGLELFTDKDLSG